jgi:hypothetical protein
VSILHAILAEATEEELHELAEAILPYLPNAEPAPSWRWLRGQRAIGAYLDMPVGQVEKLTAADALPIYRPGGPGGIVSARTDELDAWLERSYDGPARPGRLRALGGA